MCSLIQRVSLTLVDSNINLRLDVHLCYPYFCLLAHNSFLLLQIFPTVGWWTRGWRWPVGQGEWVSERERVCVCERERKREIVRERESVCVCVWERECVCVCVREYEVKCAELDWVEKKWDHILTFTHPYFSLFTYYLRLLHRTGNGMPGRKRMPRDLEIKWGRDIKYWVWTLDLGFWIVDLGPWVKI